MKQCTLQICLKNEKNRDHKTIFTLRKLPPRHLCLVHSLGRVIAHQVDGLGPYLPPDVHVVAQINGTAYPAAGCPHHLRWRKEKLRQGWWEMRHQCVKETRVETELQKPTRIIHTRVRSVQQASCLSFGFGIVIQFIKEICRSIALSAMQCQHCQSTNLLNNSRLHLPLVLWTFLWRRLLTKVTELSISDKKQKRNVQRPSVQKPRTEVTLVSLNLPSFVPFRD